MADFVIQLRTTPGCNVPDDVNLRRLLKVLGRSYGLRAVSVLEAPRHSNGDERSDVPTPISAVIDLARQRAGHNDMLGCPSGGGASSPGGPAVCRLKARKGRALSEAPGSSGFPERASNE
jgi:hypothetical protein